MAHLAMLRDLQDETGGFLAYIPLAYHPDNNELGETLHRTGTATTGFDDLKNLAVGRLFLDNFDHIKSHWIMVTPFISQTSLHFGVNDLEGTVVREKIYHEAGAHTAQAMTLDQILRLIRGAGKSRPSATRSTASSAPSTSAGPRPRSSRVSAMRVGRIPYINCYPVYGAIDRGIVPMSAELVDGVPTALNHADGRRHARRQRDLGRRVRARRDEVFAAAGSLDLQRRPGRSVVLFSKRPASELQGRRVLVSRSSMTSVALLELLFENVWDAKPAFIPSNAELVDVARFGEEEHDARLVIGDAALHLWSRFVRRSSIRPMTGLRIPLRLRSRRRVEAVDWLPFVFAVWVAQRTAPVAEALCFHAGLIASRDWGLQHLDTLAAQAAIATGVHKTCVLEYLSGLDYGLSYQHLAGLTEFFRACRGG